MLQLQIYTNISTLESVLKFNTKLTIGSIKVKAILFLSLIS